MTDTWFAPETLFDGENLLTGQGVRLKDGQVSEIGPPPPTARPLKGCLTPGFIDLQVNGGGGVMLNTTPTRDGIAVIAAAHRHFGTVGVMPTVITDHPDVLGQAVDAAIAAQGDAGILGLHIEGPHIAIAKRGTHHPDHIRPLDDGTIKLVAQLRTADVTAMITLAPEAATTTQIAELTKMGAIVSLGHTDASAEMMEAAIAAGAHCATHLFNAMSPMTSRSPGAVGAVLNSHLTAGIICDGHHVDDRMIQLALRARPCDDLTFLVSDAMATVGGPAQFDLYGQSIRLQDGRLINGEGNLAGAHLTQSQGVGRLVQRIGLPLEQALRMAITIPAKVINAQHLAHLHGRAAGDLVLLGDDMSLTTEPLS